MFAGEGAGAGAGRARGRGPAPALAKQKREQGDITLPKSSKDEPQEYWKVRYPSPPPLLPEPPAPPSPIPALAACGVRER